MKKSELRPIRINFGLKENTLPANRLQGLSANVDFRNANRMFDPEAKFMSIVENRSAVYSEEGFHAMYENLEDAEKALYRIWYVEVEEDENIDTILEEMRNDPNVEFAEIDQLNSMYNEPNDPLYDELYGLRLMDAECAWNVSEGEDIVVAVLDTGVNYNHPDIAANMWQDSNGNFGYDFSDNDSNPIDYHGHGSHCAGTIAAVGNNNTGIIGVAPKAKIMAVKIFPNAYDSVIALALKYAVDNGAKVLSNSWGPRSRRQNAPVIEAAVNYVYSKGGICVFAAGNNNDDVQFYSPANMSATITVGATDPYDNRAGFSNFGNEVDVAAPGINILSLRHDYPGYIPDSGTSMACPHVAGAVALMLSKNPNLSFDLILNQLKTSADQINPDKYVGGGRINLCLLLKNLPPSLSNKWLEPFLSITMTS